MKLFIGILLSSLILSSNANSQGCVAVRQMGGVVAMSSSDAYNLSKGDFQIGTNYRYFHSWRHFVGTEEQTQRETLGNAVNIYSHSVDVNMFYGLTNRLQVYVAIPYVHNERSQTLTLTKNAATGTLTRYSVFAQGLADVRFGFNYWAIDPEKAHNGNIMFGFGMKLNTGDYAATDYALQKDGTTALAIMDQAIQPGDGGVGFSFELQGFTQLTKNIAGFANGYYLFNPRQSNGTYKSAAKPGLAGYQVYASPDQYFARAGVMTSVGKAKNLTFSLAGRIEGIPAYDMIGGQVAYRRPGYVVAVEPGISYHTGQHTISLFVPYNFVKNRIQSAADIADENLQNSSITDPTKYVHVQGDAAFADYSISLSYAFKIPKKRKQTPVNVPIPAITIEHTK
jgi:hypothetical protein